MNKFLSLRDIPHLEGKRVLVRADLNVPLKDGIIQDATRLEALLPTLEFLRSQGAKVILLTHLGRPKGSVVDSLRVDPLAHALSEALSCEVKKMDACIGSAVEEAVSALKHGDVILLENTRFYSEESENDAGFSKQLAGLGDVFVNDAFGVIHRAHASVVGIAQYLPTYAGFLLEKEIRALSSVLDTPEAPVCLIVGGAKIDTKIGILERFLDIADDFLIGGALANTFLYTKNHPVDGSLYQVDKAPVAEQFLKSADEKDRSVYLPDDLVVESGQNVALDELASGMKILDIGKMTQSRFKQAIESAKTIIWNGPMGLYEQAAFEQGTRAIAEAVASSSAQSIIGGGDTIDAVKHFGISLDSFTHVSTGGGAMLEFLEGKELPGLQALVPK